MIKDEQLIEVGFTKTFGSFTHPELKGMYFDRGFFHTDCDCRGQEINSSEFKDMFFVQLFALALTGNYLKPTDKEVKQIFESDPKEKSITFKSKV